MATPLTADDPASLGAFRLAGRLGEGGQGVVYLAHSPSGEPVAIKLLSTGDRETRARLARELDALEGIASFCTARVLDVSADGPRPYVVSEFVDGPSLADRVRERGPLRGGDLERLAVGTATALAAIHAAGIVHRDFKPANVLLGPDGPRVVDFGIARAEGAATMTSGLIGTPAYLSPEQIGGSPASPASDVFAWAASMVYAATGVSPFGADTVPAVLHRVLQAEPDLSALPPRLRAQIGAALSKDPLRRPAAQQLIVALLNPNTPAPLTPHRTQPPHAAPPRPVGPHGTPSGVPSPSATGTSSGGPPSQPVPSGPPSQSFHGGPPPRHGPVGTPSGGPPSQEALTGPQRGVGATTETSARPRGRGLLIGGVAVVVALAAGGAALYATRTPTMGDGTPTSSAAPPQTLTAPATPQEYPSESPPVTHTATPVPTGPTTPAGDLKIPAAYEGKWSGHTTSTNPLDADGAENTVELDEGESSASWSEENQDGDCTGTITLTKVEPQRLTFSLGQNEGNCIAGTIWLTLKDDTLVYLWRDVPGLDLVTQTGTLRKG
ncbi:serine/threonine-protein kinase [Nonomuraea jiangxiensis]|uniref:Serine/threonine protein kinase n=1 Tax=Nonomuraea jiangxiensis TaxID=633440 RepID=A0A1G8WWH7_9ACTN|nr:serine/threonine-protein kinase [Nonomuraea jiangxiensis]SDJ82584.1 Serine/threonine protein kinase [Nonomuraea jiangxiensis]